VTERAGDANSGDVIVGVHGCLNTHNSVHLEQRSRRRRTLKIDFSEDPGRQHVRVYFQPYLERRRGIHILLDDLMQAEFVGPELLVAHGIKPEYLFTVGDEGV
jgi:hypothetical protein